MLSNINDYIYKLYRFRVERFQLFTYIAQGIRNGSTIKELIQSIIPQYRKRGSLKMEAMLHEALYRMEEMGSSDIKAMQEAGIITEDEYLAIESIANEDPYKAMIFLNEQSRNENNLRWAIGMLFFPTIFVLTLFTIFQPEMKAMTMEMLEPVNSISKKLIEAPWYLQDRSVFAGALAGSIAFMLSIFGSIHYLQKNNIPLLFKLLPIKEKEFVLNNFEAFLSLLKAGVSEMRIVEILSERGKNNVAKTIFKNAREKISTGESTLSEVLENYNIDPATIAYIKSGEDNNFLMEAIQSVVDYNRERYNKMVSKMSKMFPLIGEIIMTIVLLLPLIDIINVTTIGVLNFEV